jgi:hypothetical protein
LRVAIRVALTIPSAKFTSAAAAAAAENASAGPFNALGNVADGFAVDFGAFNATFSRAARARAIIAQITVLEKKLAELAGR